MHNCSNCGPKPEADFYRIRGYLMSRCKSCWNKKVKEFCRTDRGRAMRRRITKKYRNTPQGKSTLEQSKKRNRKKILARGRLNSAIRRKKLERLPCEVCGAVAEGHHENYDKPLEVRWLCTKHHHEAHLV